MSIDPENGATVSTGMQVNGVLYSLSKKSVAVPATALRVALGTSFVVWLSASDVCRIVVTSDDDGDDVIVHNCVFSIHRIVGGSKP